MISEDKKTVAVLNPDGKKFLQLQLPIPAIEDTRWKSPHVPRGKSR